jgi:hypothetical protein
MEFQNGDVLSAATVARGLTFQAPDDRWTVAVTVICFRFARGLVICQTRW